MSRPMTMSPAMQSTVAPAFLGTLIASTREPAYSVPKLRPRARTAEADLHRTILDAIRPVLSARTAKTFTERLTASFMVVGPALIALAALTRARSSAPATGPDNLEPFLRVVDAWGGEEWRFAVMDADRSVRAALKAAARVQASHWAIEDPMARSVWAAALIAEVLSVGWCWWAILAAARTPAAISPFARKEIFESMGVAARNAWRVARVPELELAEAETPLDLVGHLDAELGAIEAEAEVQAAEALLIAERPES